MKIFSEGAKASHWLLVSLCRYCYIMLARTYIDSSRIRIEHCQIPANLAAPLGSRLSLTSFCHSILSSLKKLDALRPGAMVGKSPKRDRHELAGLHQCDDRNLRN